MTDNQREAARAVLYTPFTLSYRPLENPRWIYHQPENKSISFWNNLPWRDAIPLCVFIWQSSPAVQQILICNNNLIHGYCIPFPMHYTDVTMSSMAFQITSLTIVYSTVYSDADQRKHQSSASLAFLRGIHRWPVNFPHKSPVTRKMFPFDDVIMVCAHFHVLSNQELTYGQMFTVLQWSSSLAELHTPFRIVRYKPPYPRTSCNHYGQFVLRNTDILQKSLL